MVQKTLKGKPFVAPLREAARYSINSIELKFAYDRASGTKPSILRQAVKEAVHGVNPAIKMEFIPCAYAKTGMMSIKALKEEFPAIMKEIKSIPAITTVEHVTDSSLIHATLVI